MQITFQNPGFDYSVNSILLFQTEETSNWRKDALYSFYPQIDREQMEQVNRTEQAEYLRKVLSNVYCQLVPELEEKQAAYQAHWEENRQEIEDALGDIFRTPLADRFQNIRANITLNPICPRFLKERTFDLFYRNSPGGALGMALHEIVHFLWFDRWESIFHDDPAEYEAPHLKWIFSEMAVKAILGSPRLAERNPYYPDSCVYAYFYTMTVENRRILETMDELFARGDIDRFMAEGYRYCREHEAEIRRQIR